MAYRDSRRKLTTLGVVKVTRSLHDTMLINDDCLWEAMSEDSWRDMIVGERMTVDRAFEDRIEASPFSRQQWGLVMTAVEFQIAGDEESGYQLVADTSNLGHVLPELDRMASQGMGGSGAAPGGQGLGSRDSDGFLESVKDALGLGSGGADDEQREAAKTLVTEYAKQLQTELEESGKWEKICTRASTSTVE